MQWMGAIRIRVHAADKNITIIHIFGLFSLESVLDLCLLLSWFRVDYFTIGESNVMDRGLYVLCLCFIKKMFGVKNTLMDLFLVNTAFHFTSHHKTLIGELESCGLLVDNCNGFISCLDSHSDGTHSLQRIHWWASDVMLFLQFFSNEGTHSSTSWMAWGLSTFSFLYELFL